MKFRFDSAAGMAVALLSLAAGSAAHAQEVYAGAGLFGVQLGYAYAVTPSVTVRGDVLTMGSRTKTANESGTQYQAKLKLNRTAVVADWFPYESSTFRLTWGATFNNVAFDLKAGGAGSKVDINGKTYNLANNDSLNVKIKMPSTTPYVGLGWGHKLGSKGWGFHADLGVSIGRFQLSETRSGELVNGGKLGVTQADVDKEMTEIRDNLGKINFLPQVTAGVSYRF